MEFKDYIDAGAEKFDKNLAALGREIGQVREAVSAAKRHERGLTDEAIFKLAEIIKTDPALIIAARERALAKTKEKREFWESYLKKRNALSIVFAIAICSSSTTPYSTESTENQGDEAKQSVDILYYVK